MTGPTLPVFPDPDPRDGKNFQNNTGKNLETKKRAHKICAKNAQIRPKMSKNAKKGTKRPKLF